MVIGVGVAAVTTEGRGIVLDMGEGVRVRVRSAELTTIGTARTTDTSVTSMHEALRVANHWLAGSVDRRQAFRAGTRPTAQTADSAPPIARPEWGTGGDGAFPALGYRLLAAMRVYGTFRIFSPYASLFTRPWDSVFVSASQHVAQAADALEYTRAIAAFVRETNDTHSQIASTALLRDLFGEGTLPLHAQFVDGALVVMRTLSSIRDTTRLSVGDVIERVDGTRIDARSISLTTYIPASTPQSLRSMLATRALRGPQASVATLDVRGADSVRRVVKLQRTGPLVPHDRFARGGPAVAMLSPRIAYVDLERVNEREVDSVFVTIAGAESLILDLRGLPSSGAWRVAGYLNRFGRPVPGALFTRPNRISVDSGTFWSDTMVERAPSAPQRFLGRTVMLMDERTINQGELLALMLGSINGTTLVGSRTQGAVGDITAFALPANMRVFMTGQAALRADGWSPQGRGIEPDLTVVPTLQGVRAGIDEVLTAAFQHLGGRGIVRMLDDPPSPAQLGINKHP
jgi:C-terminal processing protease CtpA/Prc